MNFSSFLTFDSQPFEVDEKGGTLDILDTAGIHLGTSMNQPWIRSCEAFVLCYSIASRKSFEAAEEELGIIYRAKDIDPTEEDPFPFVLLTGTSLVKLRLHHYHGNSLTCVLGTKCDLADATGGAHGGGNAPRFQVPRGVCRVLGQDRPQRGASLFWHRAADAREGERQSRGAQREANCSRNAQTNTQRSVPQIGACSNC
jgi:hypothetical protein